MKIDRFELYKDRLNSELQNYLVRPFPEIVAWSDETKVKEYIREQVISRIIRGDIPDTFVSVNFRLLESLVSLFYSRPGMVMNVDELAKELRASKTTIENHLFYLQFSLLVRIVRNYRPNIRSESRKMKKVYPYSVALALSLNNLEKEQINESLVAGILN